MKAYKLGTEKKLKRILARLYKKDRTRYEILMKKIKKFSVGKISTVVVCRACPNTWRVKVPLLA